MAISSPPIYGTETNLNVGGEAHRMPRLSHLVVVVLGAKVLMWVEVQGVRWWRK